MSAQFGMISFDQQTLSKEQLQHARMQLLPHGPDAEASFLSEAAAILYRGFHVTKESHSECQPYRLISGEVVTWTGRLDNGHELLQELQMRSSDGLPDGKIAALSYERWGTTGFARIVGDWTCSVWNPIERQLILAVDSIGIGRLYYRRSGESVGWSTCLEALLADRADEQLDEEYVAGWLSMFPAEHLTPYRSVRAVPAAAYVTFQSKRTTVHRYWSLDGGKTIRHASDLDYEENFRAVFKQAVRRRLRATRPIVAELSGGMDSSSIVCTADLLKREHQVDVDLHTISYHNDEEPNWNELPYFTLIERQRGRTGRHVNLAGKAIQQTWVASSRSLPGVHAGLTSLGRSEFLDEIGARVLLSGIGGDEITGGVPTPTPELANHFSAFRFGEFAHRLAIWAIETRRPWMHVFSDVIASFMSRPSKRRNEIVPAWITDSFMRRNERALSGYRVPFKFFGARPSFQEGVAAIAFLSRQLSCVPNPIHPVYERRYPFLDRDLLEFVLAVPREQIVRPGQRRSLLRRALRGIVPDEILDRRRKAFVARTPALLLAARSERTGQKPMYLGRLGIVDTERFDHALEEIRIGRSHLAAPLIRALVLEDWISTTPRISFARPTS